MKKRLIPLTALALLSLVACGGGGSSSSTPSSEPAPSSQTSSATDPAPSTDPEPSSSSDPEPSSSDPAVEYHVSITNKEALAAEWHVNQPERSATVTLDPAMNIMEALAEGDLVLSSSNEEVVRVSGVKVYAVGVGTATVTANYKGATDTVEITVGESLHGQSEADPFTASEAYDLAMTLEANVATEQYYYIKGYITSILDPYSSGYGNATFFIGDAKGATEKLFECYRVKVADAELGAEVLEEAEVLVKCTIQLYNGKTPENKAGDLLSATGGKKDEAPTGHGWAEDDTFTVAEALARCGELAENASDKYACFVTGVVTEIVAPGATMQFRIGDAADATDTLLIYNLPVGEDAAKVLVGATVVVNVHLKKYHSTSDPSQPVILETSGNAEDKLLSAEGGTAYIPETGHGWEENDPFTVAEALAQEDNANQEMYIAGKVKSVKTAYSEQYNNITIFVQDEGVDNELQVYRLKCTAEQAPDIVAGSTIVIKGYLSSYQGAKQVAAGATIVSLTAAENPEPDPEVKTGHGWEETDPFTVAEALAQDENPNQDMYVTGKVKSVKTAYSEQYNNISVFLQDEGDDANEIQVYRLACTAEQAEKILPGATLVVKGKLGSYQDVKQIAAGGTIISLVEAPAVDPEPEPEPEPDPYDVLATFALGEDGAATHADGSEAATYSETAGDYTLDITNATKTYQNARDAKGNSCLKLGTGKAVASFTINVPENVEAVRIFVAGYKGNKAVVTVNDGDPVTIETYSDNGEYTAIVATPVDGKVVFATTSGGMRAMINTIEFVVTAAE